MTGAARAAPALVLVLLAAGARPAAAFQRTSTCAGRPDGGYALWWGSRSITLGFSTAHKPSGCVDLATAEDLVAASFLTWNAATRSGETQPCTDFTFLHGPSSAAFLVGARDGQNLIAFRQGACARLAAGDPCLTMGGCANLFNCWEQDRAPGTLAITWVSFSTGSGEISDADIELDDWDGSSGYLYTCSSPRSPRCAANGDPSPAGCTWIDVGAVVTHESGHVLGLDHPCSAGPCSPPAVMSPSIAVGDTLRALYPDDVDGVCAIYPRGQPTAQAKLSGSCTGDAKGCGCPAASAPVALLLPLLLRARRPPLRRSPPRSSRPR